MLIHCWIMKDQHSRLESKQCLLRTIQFPCSTSRTIAGSFRKNNALDLFSPPKRGAYILVRVTEKRVMNVSAISPKYI